MTKSAFHELLQKTAHARRSASRLEALTKFAQLDATSFGSPAQGPIDRKAFLRLYANRMRELGFGGGRVRAQAAKARPERTDLVGALQPLNPTVSGETARRTTAVFAPDRPKAQAVPSNGLPQKPPAHLLRRKAAPDARDQLNQMGTNMLRTTKALVTNPVETLRRHFAGKSVR